MCPAKCSYQGCSNTSEHKSMFSFPVTDYHRVEIWKKHSGNPALASLADKQLKRRMLCQDHFDAKDINTFYQNNRLSCSAIPHMYTQDTSPGVERPPEHLNGETPLKGYIRRFIYVPMRKKPSSSCRSSMVDESEDSLPAEPTLLDSTPVDPSLLGCRPEAPTLLDSTPVDPLLLDNKPVLSTLLDSTPVEPTILDPISIDLTPVDPTLLDCKPVLSTLLDSTSVEPILLDPLSIDPTPVDPTPLECKPEVSTLSDSITADPTISDSISIDSTPIDPTFLDSTFAPLECKPEPSTLSDSITADPTISDSLYIYSTPVDPTFLDSTSAVSTDSSLLECKPDVSTLLDSTLSDYTAVDSTLLDSTAVDRTILDTPPSHSTTVNPNILDTSPSPFKPTLDFTSKNSRQLNSTLESIAAELTHMDLRPPSPEHLTVKIPHKSYTKRCVYLTMPKQQSSSCRSSMIYESEHPIPVEPNLVGFKPVDPILLDTKPIDCTLFEPLPPADPTLLDCNAVITTPVNSKPEDPRKGGQLYLNYTSVDPKLIDPTPLESTPADPTTLDLTLLGSTSEDHTVIDRPGFFTPVGFTPFVTKPPVKPKPAVKTKTAPEPLEVEDKTHQTDLLQLKREIGTLKIKNQILKQRVRQLSINSYKKKLAFLERFKFQTEASKTLAIMQLRRTQRPWKDEEKELCMSIYKKSRSTFLYMKNMGIVLPPRKTVRLWLAKQRSSEEVQHPADIHK